MIILASQSPRRKEILQTILKDKEFLCIPSSFDERQIQEDSLYDLCLEEAICKGEVISKEYKDSYIISSDTMVSFNNEQLGKPKDKEEAFEMIKKLQGNTHEIITAYSIIKDEKVLVKKVCKAVLFIEKMSDDKIKAYVDTLSPLDKAGGYGIQDEKYIHSKIIEGEKETIMGLPKSELTKDLINLNLL